MTARLLAAAPILVALVAAEAAADPYGDPPPEREGFLIGVGLGPAVFKGAGSELGEVQGVGGDFNIKIGTTAGEHLLWLVEVQSGGYQVDVTSEGPTDTTYNALATLTVSGQLYVQNALWLRGGAGVAGFGLQEGRDGPEVPGSRRGGLAAVAGGGYDLFRRGRFALSGEAGVSAALFGGGAIVRTAFLLGVTWY